MAHRAHGVGRIAGKKASIILFPATNEKGEWLPRTRQDGSPVKNARGEVIYRVYALVTLMSNTGRKDKNGKKISNKKTLMITSWPLIQVLLKYAPTGTSLEYFGEDITNSYQLPDGSWRESNFCRINGRDGQFILGGRSQSGMKLTKNRYGIKPQKAGAGVKVQYFEADLAPVNFAVRGEVATGVAATGPAPIGGMQVGAAPVTGAPGMTAGIVGAPGMGSGVVFDAGDDDDDR